ncbi:hypothetical protein ACF3M1_01485 [Luteimonas sp. WGS1318]|uniref:hypothetical protein n=1 Tax=Luteimonas sp. WGS1318 TaxID=3366815 RepID=UPI00372D2FCF
MKMSIDDAKWLQECLITMATDDISPISFAYGGGDDRDQWQRIVDRYYRFLVCEIAETYPSLLGHNEIQDYVKCLSLVDPFDESGKNPDDLVVWYGSDIRCSYKGGLIVSKYGLLNADAAEDLAAHWMHTAKISPERFPANGIKDADAALLLAKQLFECAAISRAAGWRLSNEWPELNLGLIEELEDIFDKYGVPWNEGPLVPIRSL